MRKIILVTIFVLFSIIAYGQNGGDLKFLGIPINGTESQFSTQLKAKGFTYNPLLKSYQGQFNGKPVEVYIHTNHNLVDRVYVAFPYTSEEDIKIEFNHLLRQFNDNGKYIDLSMNSEIPEKDDISYEISVNNKRYQASFTYFNPDRDPIAFADALLDKFKDFFTGEQLVKLREYSRKAIGLSESEREALRTKMIADMQVMGMGVSENEQPDEERQLKFLLTFMDGMKSLADGDVWFMIHSAYGQYQIGLYYDNLHNQAHGEDL